MHQGTPYSAQNVVVTDPDNGLLPVFHAQSTCPGTDKSRIGWENLRLTGSERNLIFNRRRGIQGFENIYLTTKYMHLDNTPSIIYFDGAKSNYM